MGVCIFCSTFQFVVYFNLLDCSINLHLSFICACCDTKHVFFLLCLFVCVNIYLCSCVWIQVHTVTHVENRTTLDAHPHLPFLKHSLSYCLLWHITEYLVKNLVTMLSPSPMSLWALWDYCLWATESSFHMGSENMSLGCQTYIENAFAYWFISLDPILIILTISSLCRYVLYCWSLLIYL